MSFSFLKVMKFVLIFALFVFAAARAAEDDDGDLVELIKHIDKFFDDCRDFKATVKGKCPGLVPEPACLRCVLKGCRKDQGQDNFCDDLNNCAENNPARC